MNIRKYIKSDIVVIGLAILISTLVWISYINSLTYLEYKVSNARFKYVIAANQCISNKVPRQCQIALIYLKEYKEAMQKVLERKGEV